MKNTKKTWGEALWDALTFRTELTIAHEVHSTRISVQKDFKKWLKIGKEMDIVEKEFKEFEKMRLNPCLRQTPLAQKRYFNLKAKYKFID